MLTAAMFVPTTPASTARSLDDGLVAYFPFNGNANDESGHGTVHGALTGDGFGQPNRAYRFDGADNQQAGDGDSGSFTLSVWIDNINL